jgi:hypothetical protein
MCLCLHVKYLLSLSYINQNLDVSTNFSKNVPNVKFYENPCRESRVVDGDRQVDMTNLEYVFVLQRT